jgi:UDP-N-acetyl-D-mannosaminuronic acid dehydrogenase
MAKLTENAFRDVNIAFANELSIICDKVDINVWELIRLANRHPRVNILKPGPGVGGHCIAVDPWFIVSETPDEARLIHRARQVNDSKPAWVIEKIKLALAEHLIENPQKRSEDVVIACYGVAFKPDIDDLRESPALHIAEAVTQFHPGPTYIVEPNIDVLPETLSRGKLESVQYAIERADINLVFVSHKEFKKEKEILEGTKCMFFCEV